MARILLLIVLIGLIYWVAKQVIAAANTKAQNNSDTKPDEKLSEKIVQCSRCGLHVPETESHISNQQVVCNNAECNQST